MTPRVLHTPVASARAGKPIAVRAQVQGDWRLAELALRYRPAGEAQFATVPVERSRKGDWVATIPADAVRGDGVAYYIESRGADGVVRGHFASAEAPHPVSVEGEAPADVMADQLARYGGAQSRFRLDGSMVAYGTVPRDTDGLLVRTDRYSDRMWTLEGEYTYRPLTWLHDMRFGFGLMRAEWPEVDGAATRDGETPGLNYGYAEVNFELHRWFTVGGRLFLGASEVGFTAGVGGVARVGDLTGTHFAVRADVIGDVGSRTDLRFHWTTVPRVPMSLGIEFTDWPANSEDAANLSYTAGVEVTDAITVNARIGTANRSRSIEGGYQGGLGVMLDF